MKYLLILLMASSSFAADKYGFTGDTMSYNGHTLQRIVLLQNNQLGGWIESASNLSQSGHAWVSSEAKVYSSGRVTGDGWVGGQAEVSDGTVQGTGVVVGSSVLSGGVVDSGGMLQFSATWSSGTLTTKKNN